jgi:hypothetical protein
LNQESSFVLCQASAVDGTIYWDQTGNVILDGLNFSACVALYGPAWISNSPSSSAVWSLTFSTLLQCSGYTIIDSQTTSITTQVIECSNFYWNSLLSSTSGVIWVRNYALVYTDR